MTLEKVRRRLSTVTKKIVRWEEILPTCLIRPNSETV